MYLWRIVKGALAMGVSVTGDALVSILRNVPPSSLALVVIVCQWQQELVSTSYMRYTVIITLCTYPVLSLHAAVSKQALPELRDHPNYLSEKSFTEVRKRKFFFVSVRVWQGHGLEWICQSYFKALNLKDHLSFFRLSPNEGFRGFPKNYEVFWDCWKSLENFLRITRGRPRKKTEKWPEF